MPLAVLVEIAALLLVPATAVWRAAGRPLLHLSPLERIELELQLAHVAQRSVALIRQSVVRRRRAEDVPPAARRGDDGALHRSSLLLLVEVRRTDGVAVWVAARRRIAVDVAP